MAAFDRYLCDMGRESERATVLGRLARDRRQIIPWLSRTRDLRGARIIEIGCGLGASTVALAEQGADLLAIDVAGEDVEAARKLTKAHDVGAKFVVANAAEIDEIVQPGDANWIIFWAVLEHMTIRERLQSLSRAWQTLSPGGLLTVVETPNRLWHFDSHTSLLPFFDWLPDELAFEYSRYSPRASFCSAFRQRSEEDMLRFLRRGRGMSFHELELAIAPVQDLDIASAYQLERRARNPARRLGWALSRAGRYEAMLRKTASTVPRALLQPFHYFTARKG